MTAQTKQKARNLERVRVNQQRSRDRKRQYTAELERKVEQLEHRLRPSNASSDSDADGRLERLSRENNIRRDLLCVLGINVEAQEQFVRAASSQRQGFNALNPRHGEDVPDIFQSARPSPPTEDAHCTGTPSTATFDMSPVSIADFDELAKIKNPMSPRETIGLSAQASHLPAFPTGSLSLLNPSSTAASLLETIHAQMMSSRTATPPPKPTLCSNCSSCTSATPTIPTFPSDSTTACSLAFSMVVSNNKRGYEFVDLESRMRAGYQKGSTPGEECRILNKVLFAVLAEIT